MLSKLLSTVVFLFILMSISGLATAQTSSCRGTGVSGSGQNITLLCAGSCGTGSCDSRNGTGAYVTYKICNCAQGDAPNGCCGLALKRSGAGGSATFSVVTVGDCIGCDFVDKVCQKIGQGDQAQAVCISAGPPPTPQ